MPGPTAPPPPQAGIVHPNAVLLVDRTSVAFTATTMGGKPHVYVRAQHHTQWSNLTSDLQVRANHLAAEGSGMAQEGMHRFPGTLHGMPQLFSSSLLVTAVPRQVDRLYARLV